MLLWTLVTAVSSAMSIGVQLTGRCRRKPVMYCCALSPYPVPGTTEMYRTPRGGVTGAVTSGGTARSPADLEDPSPDFAADRRPAEPSDDRVAFTDSDGLRLLGQHIDEPRGQVLGVEFGNKHSVPVEPAAIARRVKAHWPCATRQALE